MTKVTLLKTPTCTINCNKVAAELDRLGIAYAFETIDTDNPQHVAMLVAADKADYRESPVICLPNSEDSLRFIGAGSSQIGIQALKAALKELASVDA